MKLVEGGNLADRLDEFKANPKAVAALLAEVAGAVHHGVIAVACYTATSSRRTSWWTRAALRWW